MLVARGWRCARRVAATAGRRAGRCRARAGAGRAPAAADRRSRAAGRAAGRPTGSTARHDPAGGCCWPAARPSSPGSPPPASPAYGVRTALGPPRLDRVRIPLAKLPREHGRPPDRVVSDIHLGPLRRPRAHRADRRHDQRLDADLVAVVGDLVDGTRRRAGRGGRAAARPARPGTAAYFVTGNHEYYSGVERVGRRGRPARPAAAAQRAGGDPARAGARPGRRQRRRPASDVPATAPTSTPRSATATRAGPVVLLAHQPVQVARGRQARRRPAAVRAHPRRPDVAVQPASSGCSSRWSPGSATVDGTQVYVTNGAGFWGPPVRVGAPPQITLVELRSRIGGTPRPRRGGAARRIDGRRVTGCGVLPFSAVPPVASAFVADLHIHSKYSRACSRDLTCRTSRWWARRKGISAARHRRLHPPGLVRPPARDARARPSRACSGSTRRPRTSCTSGCRRGWPHGGRAQVRFMLSRGDLHDLQARRPDPQGAPPDLPARPRRGRPGSTPRSAGSATSAPTAGRSSAWTPATCWRSPWRPARTATWCPAHIWTPWFSALGSKSGFDAIADCYADLAEHIFAVETGLSSDPAMNWRVVQPGPLPPGVQLGRALAAGAGPRGDAASPPTLDYFAVREALRTGDGLAGTIEFFPEEGKYHADGHRACGVNWEPGADPRRRRPLPGVRQAAHRRRAAPGRGAGRPAGGAPPADAHAGSPTWSSCAEILGEIARRRRRGPRPSRGGSTRWSPRSARSWRSSREAPLDEIGRAGGELLGEAIGRLRRGEVQRTPGLRRRVRRHQAVRPGRAARRAHAQADALFDVPVPQQRRSSRGRAAASARRDGEGRAPQARAGGRRRSPPPPPPSPHEPFEPMLAGMEEVGTGLLDRLDAMQRVAASAPGGPLLIVAGPGTGKTRTLTHRIAYLCAELDVFPEHCLAITFTRRAAEELRHRLDGLLGPVAEDVTVATFHALGLAILRENAAAVGLPAGLPHRRRRRARDGAAPPSARPRRRRPTDRTYAKAAARRTWSTWTSWSRCRWSCCAGDPDLVDRYRDRWRWIFVDEYQDVDAGAVRAAAAALPAGRQPLRDRRPGPGDLLVPRRRRRRTSCGSPRTSPTPGSCG